MLKTSNAREVVTACLEQPSGDTWQTFTDTFHRSIAAAVIRACRRCGAEPRVDIVDDLIQDTYVKLFANECRVLRSAHSTEDAGLHSLMQAVAVTTVVDHFRSSKARGGGHGTEQLDSPALARLVDGSALQLLDRQVLLNELERHLEAIVSPENGARDTRVFWLYYRHGFTSKAISAIPAIGMGEKGVESLILRLTARLREALQCFAGTPEGESL